eukprot:m.130460 g.130460  ORF g.130460 m.130460 type:complete len:300 (-) comp16434_c1_seq5:184-1083(-)
MKGQETKERVVQEREMEDSGVKQSSSQSSLFLLGTLGHELHDRSHALVRDPALLQQRALGLVDLMQLGSAVAADELLGEHERLGRLLGHGRHTRLHRRGKLVVREHLGHKVALFGLARIQRASHQQHLVGSRDPHDLREQQRRTALGTLAERHKGGREGGLVAGIHNVAQGKRRHHDAKGGAVHCRHQRLREVDVRADKLLQQLCGIASHGLRALGRNVGEVRQVISTGEVVAVPRDHGHGGVAATACVAQGIGQAIVHLQVEGVFLGRAVERDGVDAVLAVGKQNGITIAAAVAAGGG